MKPFPETVAVALIKALVGEDPEILERVDMNRAMARVTETHGRLPKSIGWVFTLTIWMFGYGLPPFSWRFRNFSTLDAEARLRYLESWAGSRWMIKTNLFTLLRVVLLAGVLQEPALLDWIGYGEARQRRMRGIDAAGLASDVTGKAIES